MAKLEELSDLEFRRYVVKKLKLLEGLIDDQFASINTFDENNRTLAEEANDHASRAERAVRRLKKEFDDHEHDEDE